MRALAWLIVAGCSGSDVTAPAAPPPAPAPPPRSLEAALDFARTLAVDVTGPIIPATPIAGDYAMSLDMRFEQFVTTEMRIADARSGAMRLSLLADSSAGACLGVRDHSSSQGQMHYERDPAKRRHSDNQHAGLVALAGRWTMAGGVATIVFDREAWGTCDPQGATPRDPAPVTLRCIALAANALVPAGTLVCESGEHDDLHGLGMPFTQAARAPGMHSPSNAPSGHDVMLAPAGIHVEVLEERRSVPDVKITTAAVNLVETDYRATP